MRNVVSSRGALTIQDRVTSVTSRYSIQDAAPFKGTDRFEATARSDSAIANQLFQTIRKSSSECNSYESIPSSCTNQDATTNRERCLFGTACKNIVISMATNIVSLNSGLKDA